MQDQSLNWPYSVEHLLEYFDDSRTEASSGIDYIPKRTHPLRIFKRLSSSFVNPHGEEWHKRLIPLDGD